MNQHRCAGCGRKVMWLTDETPPGWEGQLCRRCAVVARLLLSALRWVGRVTA